jgi:hypothetical protein
VWLMSSEFAWAIRFLSELQGVAESDFFLVAISQHSVSSEWVKKELNGRVARN